MKRLISLSAALALFASIGIVGCGEEATTQTTVERSTPSGTTTETVETTTEQTGDTPPPPTGVSGEPAPTTP